MLCFLRLVSAFLAVVLLALPGTCSAQAPAPATAAKLRRLLPFPEETLRRKMELDIGISYVPGGSSEILRDSTDCAAQIVQVRRKLTGGIADAGRYYHLGYLYRVAGLASKSKAAFRRSGNICQETLRQEPDNGLALAEYGRTLAATEQTTQAEHWLKNAIRTVPQSADVWRALGFILSQQVSPKTEKTAHFARDAVAACNQAIRLAPQNPAVWKDRGDVRDWVLPRLQGQWLSRDGLSDYEHAAALDARNPYAQAMVPTVDYAWVEVHYNLPTSPQAAAKETPAAVRRAKTALRRITAIAQSTTGRQSASAYAARAWVQFQFCYDPKGAQKSLRLALRQNPYQQDAIDYQMHVAAVTGDYVLLAAACRRELRRQPKIYLRVLLADADFNVAQQKPRYWQEGLMQIKKAHAAAPRDYACTLGLATFLLESKQAARAGLPLAEIAPQALKRPKEQQAEYDLTRGISEALAGHAEEARALLALALQEDPHNQPAKSALMLLPD